MYSYGISIFCALKMEVTNALKELFFEYEDMLERKGIAAVGEIDEIYAGGVTLNPDFYDEDGERCMKVLITVECHSRSQDELDQIDEDTLDAISDTVNDYLMGRGLGNDLQKLDIDPDILDWWPVKLVAVE